MINTPLLILILFCTLDLGASLARHGKEKLSKTVSFWMQALQWGIVMWLVMASHGYNLIR